MIQKGRKRRRNTRRGIGIVIAVAAIIGIVFLVNGSGHKAATPTTTTSTSTSSTTTSSTVPPTTFPTPTTQPLTTAAVAPTCPPAKGSPKRVVYFTAAPPHCIPANSVWKATFQTSLGAIVVQMSAASSYAAVNNFVVLARYQYYNGTLFHRVIPGFIVQGGDPTGTGTGGAIANGKRGKDKYGYPGYEFTGNTPPASCSTKPTQAACYQPGDLAMANTGEPTSDGSQFFFILPGGQTTLGILYTDFGKVTSGMKVVEKIGALGGPAPNGVPKVKVYLLSVALQEISG